MCRVPYGWQEANPFFKWDKINDTCPLNHGGEDWSLTLYFCIFIYSHSYCGEFHREKNITGLMSLACYMKWMLVAGD